MARTDVAPVEPGPVTPDSGRLATKARRTEGLQCSEPVSEPHPCSGRSPTEPSQSNVRTFKARAFVSEFSRRCLAAAEDEQAGTVGTGPSNYEWLFYVRALAVTVPSVGQVSVLVRPHAINLLVENESPSFTFDPLGRLHGAFVAGRNYRRSLDNRVLCKWTEPAGGRRQRQRRWLAESDARSVIDTAYGLARQMIATAGDAPVVVREALKRLAQWDAVALEQDRLRFEAIYTPIGILPPDQYLALVLQATHGCSHNACTFCTFYRGIDFSIKSPEAFRSHVAAVIDFFGPALAMRRSIFLADANALVIPMPRLVALLDVLSEVSGVRCQVSGAGVSRLVPDATSEYLTPDTLTPDTLRPLPLFAFIDAFHVERKSVSDWSELRARGLRRVYIGMESGHDPLLDWLNKPGDAADVLDAVRTSQDGRLERQRDSDAGCGRGSLRSRPCRGYGGASERHAAGSR